jgi:hypothetical protein
MLQTEGLFVDDATMSADVQHRAGDFAPSDRISNDGVHAPEASRRERRRLRRRRSERAQCERPQAAQKATPQDHL